MFYHSCFESEWRSGAEESVPNWVLFYLFCHFILPFFVIEIRVGGEGKIQPSFSYCCFYGELWSEKLCASCSSTVICLIQ